MFKKTDLICDVLEKSENAEEILTEFGFHCIYCPAAQMESLEEASYVHGVDVNELIEALNASAKTTTKTTKTKTCQSKETKPKSTKSAAKTTTKTATKTTKTSTKTVGKSKISKAKK